MNIGMIIRMFSSVRVLKIIPSNVEHKVFGGREHVPSVMAIVLGAVFARVAAFEHSEQHEFIIRESLSEQRTAAVSLRNQ